MPDQQSFAIVIVNYGNAALALEAARSALGAATLGPESKVVIVDNGSRDTSLDIFEAALRYDQWPQLEQSHRLKNICLKPIAAIRPAIISAQKTIGIEPKFVTEYGDPEAANLVLIKNDHNGGFAAGNNVGLIWLRAFAITHFLLLNPDAVLEESALFGFVACLKDRRVGLAGATLLSFAPPWPVQAYGGARLHPITLLGRNIGAGVEEQHDPKRLIAAHKQARRHIDYPIGAAMAFRRDWLDHVGLMDERFFLYYEEADWVARGANRYHPAWAEGAICYHHHGASIGSRLKHQRRSALADYHMIRSRALYAMKWRPWLLPILWGLGLIQSLRRIMRGQWAQAKAILRATLPMAPRRFIS